MGAQSVIEQVAAGNAYVYPRSKHEHEGTKLQIVKAADRKYILAEGSGKLIDELEGETANGVKLCELSHANRLVINKFFPFTVPQAFGKQSTTIGLGDRLGIAGPGHLQTVKGRAIHPILAQQSIRELALTGRDYKQVIDAAAYAALQEGYTEGYGADGDHLKKEEDIRMSLDLGFTMLTLDCSEQIDNAAAQADEAEVNRKYEALPEAVRTHYESNYLNKTFTAGSQSIHFDAATLKRDVLVYHEAIEFMVFIYEKYIKTADRAVDFEISIDETLTPTAPGSHFLVASELNAKNVDIFSMAPRFIGEFQKGIDYIGDLAQFEQELAVHAAIADHFGYKLSIHSGSDKFSVFALVGKYTNGRFHVKTAGTNWLEAVRIVARTNPSLYRKMHQYALEHFEEATAYYHVTTNLDNIRPLKEVTDEELPKYMEENDARQLLHITYGILLQAKREDGSSLFRDEFFRTLSEREEDYAHALKKHIGKHLDLLGVK
ncbi:tagaturonate epimerase family protein [Cohnella algarum]|uniref:tagaturonate epimerase family protein n=1 Tax=Cohnella algarum TaxID=2044859 RepID=UPI0019688687|nr:tagaturonate epimerase family protein [Cohnella algarum]MBN2980043.1 tagaturonate epimerase family protein [Cohnella algarum]